MRGLDEDEHDEEERHDDAVDHDGGDVTTELPYTFDADHVAGAVALIDGAYSTLDEYSAASSIHVTANAQGIGNTPLTRELWLAASYRLRRELDGRPGCDLGPEAARSDYAWPRPIRDLSDDVIALWRAVAAGVTAPAAIARFEDLLFVRRDGNGRDHARRAAEAYLAAFDPADIDMSAVDALLRAWTLARSIRDVDLDGPIRGQLAAVASHVLSTDPGRHPGVALPMLSALALGPLERTAPDRLDVDGLLATAAAVYRRGYLATQIAADRRGRAGSDPVALEHIARDELAAYFAEADDAPNAAVRMIHLQSAAQVAGQRGLSDLAKEAAARMQRIKPYELGLQRFTTQHATPRYVSESLLAGFTHGEHWRDSLAYFFAGAPPSGSVDQIKAAGGSRGALDRLFPAMVFGAGGLPRATTASAEDDESHAMSAIARGTAENVGRLLALGLDRVADRYGVPGEDDLTTAIIDAGARDPGLARSLAKGFRRYWDRDYESCVAVIVPKFEAAARNLLRELDEGIYRVQKGRDAGGYVGLYVLIDELEKLSLDESWAYFFRWLLLGPYGANIRNDVAHGFISDVGQTYAALTLRAVSVLVLVAGPAPTDSFDSGDDHDAGLDRPRDEVVGLLAAPTGPPGRMERVVGRVADWLERGAWRLRHLQARAACRRRRAR